MDLYDYFKNIIIMDRKQFLKGLFGIGVVAVIPKVITDTLPKEKELIFVPGRIHLENSCGHSKLQGYHGDIIIIDEPLHPMCRCCTEFDYWIDNTLKKRDWTWNVM